MKSPKFHQKILHIINIFADIFIINSLKNDQVINLARKLEVLHSENFNSLKKGTKKDTGKWKVLPCS